RLSVESRSSILVDGRSGIRRTREISVNHGFFTRSRPSVTNLNRAMRADIHFHLLPGLDDGPGTMEETVELARAALRDGTAIGGPPPPFRPACVPAPSDPPAGVQGARARLARERIELELHSGGELGHEMVARLGQRDLELIAVGPPSARWVLL